MQKVPEVAHDGEGSLQKVRAFEAGDFATGLDFIDYVIVPPQTTIGVHRHGDNEEIYFIVSGCGQMTLEERQVAVQAGDVVVNGCGGQHGLVNDSDAEMRVFIFQVSKG